MGDIVVEFTWNGSRRVARLNDPSMAPYSMRVAEVSVLDPENADLREYWDSETEQYRHDRETILVSGDMSFRIPMRRRWED